MDTQRAKRKERTGIVIQDAMDKTVVVRVERRVRHPLYGKEMRASNTCVVHDETNAAKVGDQVRIMETRPLSRRKRWRLVAVERAAAAPGKAIEPS